MASDAFARVPAELWCRALSFLETEPPEERLRPVYASSTAVGRTLLACSETCRAFLYPSQRLLFHKISFIGDFHMREAEDMDHLLELFMMSPHLASYVRHLHILDEDSGTHWIGTSEVLPKILELCTGVTRFTVSVREWPQEGFPMIWRGRRMRASLRCFESACLYLPQAPSLQESIRHIVLEERDGGTLPGTAIPDLLNRFPHLQQLTVRRLRSTTQSGLEVPPCFSLTGLRLEACTSSPFLDWLRPALKTLVSLHISVAPAAANTEELSSSAESFTLNERFLSWLGAIGSSIKYITIDLKVASIDKALLSFVKIFELIPNIRVLAVLGIQRRSLDLVPQLFSNLIITSWRYLEQITLELLIDSELFSINVPQNTWHGIEGAFGRFREIAATETGRNKTKLAFELVFPDSSRDISTSDALEQHAAVEAGICRALPTLSQQKLLLL